MVIWEKRKNGLIYQSSIHMVFTSSVFDGEKKAMLKSNFNILFNSKQTPKIK